jgi:hypothetical protein
MKSISNQALLELLEDSPDRLERHLIKHPDDVARLESLTELPPSQRLAVEHGVKAPDDIAQRVALRMKVDPSLRELGAVFAELFTLGVQTARVVFESPIQNERIGE